MHHSSRVAFLVVALCLVACERGGVAANDGGETPLADLACAPEDDAALCAAADRECGSRWMKDRCGIERVVECGACAGLALCDETTARCVSPSKGICDGAAWCWEQPLPFGGAGGGLASLGNEAWIAIGSLVMHWDGAAWQSINFPGRIPFAPSVSADKKKLSLGVGSPLPTGFWRSTLIALAGDAWQERFAPEANELLGLVAARDPDDVWVTTSGSSPRLMHWDGAAWTKLDSIGSTDAIHPIGPHEAITLSGELVRRWTTAGAATMPAIGLPVTMGSQPALIGWDDEVWLSSASVGGVDGTLLLRDGSWSHHPEVPIASHYTGESRSDVWAASGATLRHFDGVTWGAPHVVSEGSYVNALSGSGAHVWAQSRDGAVVEWDGVEWATRLPSPVMSGNARALSDGRTGQLWVGGRGLYRVDIGGVKTVVSPTATFEITRVYSGAADDVWAVASNATLLHCTPNAPSCAVLPTEAQINDVYGAGVNEVYFVGDDGLGLVWNGKGLIKLATYTEEKLVDVDGSSDGDVWTMSDQGHLWRRINFYSAVAAPSEGRVVAVATFGLDRPYVATYDDAAPSATAFKLWTLDTKGNWKVARTIADVALGDWGFLKKGVDGKLYILTIDGVIGETGALASRLVLNDVQIGSDGSLRGLADNFSIVAHAPVASQ